jgi:ActR/RegA family two-component response regulator/anti-sigma regulatory factor (Ser/Thr protein kinase)
LALLVQAVVASFRAAAVARGLGLEHRCPTDITVESDPDLLRRMLANLLDNAIKFTASGAVAVEVTADGGEVEIAVRDSGPGIAPEHHRLVFEDLVQLPRAGADHPPGHGLGLGIVRRAAALLNVDIALDSARGRGAVFRWRMPRADAEPGTSVAADTAPSLVGKQLLILDDNTMVRAAYAKALAHAGAEICTAGTIAEALGNARRADAAVVDWRLAEDGDGFTAIERLRDQHPAMPVVMVTADTGPKIAEAARRYGVVLLRKPVDASTLARALLGAISGPAVHHGSPSAGPLP